MDHLDVKIIILEMLTELLSECTYTTYAPEDRSGCNPHTELNVEALADKVANKLELLRKPHEPG